jgi:LacI family transcriptional regulator
VRSEGFPCAFYQPSRRTAPDDATLMEDLVGWIRKLPKPVGVMACYDLRGVQALEACRRAVIAVPEEVAVVGVDNDEVLCELSHPPLTSIIPNTHRTGHEAAALLDRLMGGARIEPGATHLIPPLGIATRQSSDVLAIEDPHVARALHYIRQHACEGIKVTDVLRALPQSRRILENKFIKLIGRTPHEEILRVRLDRVKQLLHGTRLSLAEIAGRTGFNHVEYLTVVFRNKVGLPPGKYRAQNSPKKP